MLEVEQLIEALKAADQKNDGEIFKNIPGGHSVDRIDTRIAKGIHLNIYKYLAGHSPNRSVLSKSGIKPTSDSANEWSHSA